LNLFNVRTESRPTSPSWSWTSNILSSTSYTGTNEQDTIDTYLAKWCSIYDKCRCKVINYQYISFFISISSTPMMDLLVHAASLNKLNPSGYSLVVLDSNQHVIQFKPNQTVGQIGMYINIFCF